ncbi:transcriptional regulator ExuR [Klebsiella pneumoniae]
MEIIEPRRLYQQLAAELKTRIEQGVYLVGDKLPAERFIADEKNVSRTVVREAIIMLGFIADEKNVSRTVVREAIIMLEVEGYVEVRKGSGIHVISNHPKYQQVADESLEFANYGPFELLQARQLIESNIAEFAATQVTKQDIMKLMEIQEKARNEKCFRDSEWDLQFHVQVALATQNSALAAIVEKMWTQRVHNPYWKKLHEHIDLRTVDNWCDDHDQILKALLRKDPNAAKLAMWQHLENTKQMLFNETSDDFEFNADRYLFAENPVVHLDTAVNGAK